MDTRTLRALRGSIAKWEGIVRGKLLDRGTENCPLCKLFNSSIHCACPGCPVASASSSPSCYGTPYIRWVGHHRKDHPGNRYWRVFPGCTECKRLAQAEMDFLKGLLPEEK